MALSKDKKHEVVAEVTNLLDNSKMTVVAAYPGTDVKSMQQLRRNAKDNQTKVKVIKNRLVIKALQSSDKFKNTDISALNGQLLYAFNSEDEVAPAKTLAEFAKTQPTLEFVGAFTDEGSFISAEDVKALASLPTKDQLRGQLVGILKAPLGGFVNVLSGNIRGVMNVLNARAKAID